MRKWLITFLSTFVVGAFLLAIIALSTCSSQTEDPLQSTEASHQYGDLSEQDMKTGCRRAVLKQTLYPDSADLSWGQEVSTVESARHRKNDDGETETLRDEAGNFMIITLVFVSGSGTLKNAYNMDIPVRYTCRYKPDMGGKYQLDNVDIIEG